MTDEPKSLWRYMPLMAFVRLLQTRTLHMARSDLFEDVLEGQFGFAELTKHLTTLISSHGPVEAIRRDCFLSCWLLSNSENHAMWGLYGKNEPSSVAIVSNVGAVMSAANDYCIRKEVYGMFGKVIYGNYVVNGRAGISTVALPFGRTEVSVPIGAQIFFYKASAFAHEQEWRLLLWQRKAQKLSVALPIPDPTKLIERILVAPTAHQWTVECVKELVHAQFGLKEIPVERSGLAAHYGA
jgi:hypothetical protein